MNVNPNDFNIDETAIDRELCTLGSTIYTYGEIEGQLRVELEQAKSDLERVEAEMDSFFRLQAKETGAKKTEAQIKNEILLSDLYKASLVNLVDIQKRHNHSKAAMVALSAKRDCLIALSYRDRQMMKADIY